MSKARRSTALLRRRKGDDTIIRGTVIVLAAKLTGAAFTAALTIFLARKLGSAEFGVFALALSIVTLVELPSDFGVAVAVPRFIAEHRAELRRVRELVADAVRLEALSSLLSAGALAALASVIASAYGTPSLAVPLRVLAIALVGQNFMFLFGGVFAAMRRQAPNLWASTIESACELGASVALVLIVGGASAAAFGRAIGYAVGATAAAALAIRLLGPRIIPRSPTGHGHARRIAGYAGALWIVDGAYTLFTQIDSLLIGAFLAAGSVAFFQAPMRLLALFQYPGYAIASAVSPRLARSTRAAPDANAFGRSIRLLTVLMMALTAITTVWATPIIRLTLGPGYGKAAEVLRALAPYVFLCGGAALVSTALNYLGGARRRVPIAIVTLVVNLVLDVILIPRIGVVGGAIGSDFAYSIYVLSQLYFCAAMLELPLRPCAVTLIRSSIAALPMAAALATFGTGRLAVPTILVGGLAGLGIYAAALVLTGEVSRAELRWVWDALKKRGRSPEPVPRIAGQSEPRRTRS